MSAALPLLVGPRGGTAVRRLGVHRAGISQPMGSTLRWPEAAVAGLASSMRSTAGLGALALRGRISGPARAVILLATAGEFVVDKTSAAGSRIAPPALAARIAAGAYTGRAVAGPFGIAAGGLAAAVGSYATFRARKLAAEHLGFPDPFVALSEDAAALALAAVATRPAPEECRVSEARASDHEPEPDTGIKSSWCRDASRGLLIGALATGTMTLAQGAEYALTDAEPSDVPATVAEKFKLRLGGGRIKRRNKPAANGAMHWLYGTSWGIPYGVVARRLPVAPEISGPIYGLIVWSAGLIVQPAAGVADPPWKRAPSSLRSEALFHLIYGVGAGAAQRSLPR